MAEASHAACEAARFLDRLARCGQQVEGLPQALRPENPAAGYEIQAQLQRLSAQPLFGWKLAATSKAGQDHIGVDRPLIGRLLAKQQIEDGASYRALDHNIMRVAELEFAFRFAEDVEAREAPWEPEEALARVATLHPAIELPDSRLRRYESVGAPQLIADNACAHFFVLGKASPDEWRKLDLAEQAPWGCIDGQRFRQGSGRHVLGDPRLALVWFLNETSRLRLKVRAGEIVSTGTCLQPIPIRHGVTVSGDFGALGTVAVHIA